MGAICAQQERQRTSSWRAASAWRESNSRTTRSKPLPAAMCSAVWRVCGCSAVVSGGAAGLAGGRGLRLALSCLFKSVVPRSASVNVATSPVTAAQCKSLQPLTSFLRRFIRGIGNMVTTGRQCFRRQPTTMLPTLCAESSHPWVAHSAEPLITARQWADQRHAQRRIRNAVK
jgi:hypothetical protein